MQEIFSVSLICYRSFCGPRLQQSVHCAWAL